MDVRALQDGRVAPAVVFLAAVLVLSVQLINPSPVVVSLGENGAETTRVGQYFTYTDVAVAVLASIVCGASGTYLLFDGSRSSPDPNQSPARGSDERRPGREPAGANGPRTGGGEAVADGMSGQRDDRESALDRLANNEATVYSLLVDADGTLPQRRIVEETDLSKATVSRTLDKLERRGLVERKRNGMGNTVHLL
ncbi:helix-turn-helix transcriptional regulator [Halomicrobium urmianum]|uniref:helix-turn-helix transcriptional regulator n=1 Tax=Halomicrobium urmianum TaxID=1586233 RepID=UPI001CD96827|nr:MarR family transcriptional regulator [Halomicrobium urmianum]